MQCRGKNIYQSKHEARKVRRAVGKQRSRKLRVYQCPFCHHFHLTSAPKYDIPVKKLNDA